MLNVIFIARINLRSGRTNVYNLTKTCEAINHEPGFRAQLVTTDREQNLADFYQRMGVHQPFPITCLGVTDTASPYAGWWWYEPLMFLRANFSLSWFLFKQRKSFSVLYFRDESLFLTAFFSRLFLRKAVFFEIHSVYERPFRQLKNKFSAYFSSGVVAISLGLKSYYQRINPATVVSLCSAADDIWFDSRAKKATLRQKLGLPQNSFLLGYTGVVGINPNNDYYEIDDVVRSLSLLPREIVVVVVGEMNGNAEWLRNIACENKAEDRLVIVPWQERSVIPQYLQAFDVNLIPKRKKNLVGDSPAKMFPALAADRPIVAGRAECIEEVLTNEKDALIVRENNPSGWAEAVLKIYNNSELAKKIAGQALITKNQYTWERRGQTIGSFIRAVINKQ